MELGSGGKRGGNGLLLLGMGDAEFGNLSKPSNTPEVAKGVGKQVLWEQVSLHLEQYHE